MSRDHFARGRADIIGRVATISRPMVGFVLIFVFAIVLVFVSACVYVEVGQRRCSYV